MSANRRAGKIATSAPERNSAGPTPTWLDRLIAWFKTLKGAVVAIASVGAVLGGVAGYWNAYQAARFGTPSLLALIGTANAGPLSIVVLPFANLTGDPQQAYVADGITAAVTADLSRIRDAFIVSTSTAFSYREKSVTVQQIGNELGVRFALQGGVQGSGDKIRVSAQLADTTTNAQLWSESFDGSRTNLFALQDLVTTRIGNSIGREMVVLAARDSLTGKSDRRAVDLLLRARALSLKPMSLGIYAEMQSLYRQVLLLEPGNVQAMVGLARSLSNPAYNGWISDPVAREKQFLEARDLALKAKSVDPRDPGIYPTLSEYAASHGDHEGARRAVETALSLDPKNPGRYSDLADGYIDSGEPMRAIELLTKGILLDPRNPTEVDLENMGRAQFMNGDDEAAIQWLRKALEVNPAYVSAQANLAIAYAHNGNLPRARDAVATLLRIEPKFSLLRFQTPKAGYPGGYREYWETKLLPAGRRAGLPE